MLKKQLENFAKESKLPSNIKNKIIDVLNEDDNYVADELVILSEEILVQTAAIGIAAYISQSKQKQVFNDFILQLFTTKSKSYNAGPLFRWAANMIKNLNDKTSKKIHSLFWKNNVLNEDFERLSKLRNEVMHGFFILPASRNEKEAKHIVKVLNQLIKIDIFHIYKDAPYHFFSKDNNLVFFNNNWSIEDSQWSLFDKSFDFGKLTKDIRYELSKKFEEDQTALVKNNLNNNKVIKSAIDFIGSNTRGSFAIWSKPNNDLVNDYSNLINNLDDNLYLKIFYNLDSHGINTTEDFLLRYIYKKLNLNNNIEKSTKNLKKDVVKLRKNCNKKPVIILNNIHTSLFNPYHLINLKDFFYKNDFLFISFGNNYPWLNQFFNQNYYLDSKSYIPTNEEIENSLDNYLRFKGPNFEIDEEKDAFLKLKEILFNVLKKLNSDKFICARRFADENNYLIEYVLETFSILNPYFDFSESKFEIDDINHLTNLPNEIKETSRIFLSLDRRDINLDYKHKKISL